MELSIVCGSAGHRGQFICVDYFNGVILSCIILDLVLNNINVGCQSLKIRILVRNLYCEFSGRGISIEMLALVIFFCLVTLDRRSCAVRCNCKTIALVAGWDNINSIGVRSLDHDIIFSANSQSEGVRKVELKRSVLPVRKCKHACTVYVCKRLAAGSILVIGVLGESDYRVSSLNKSSISRCRINLYGQILWIESNFVASCVHAD